MVQSGSAYLDNGQHQQQHRGCSQDALVSHNLQRRDGQICHEKVFKGDLCRLDALAAQRPFHIGNSGVDRHAGGHAEKGGNQPSHLAMMRPMPVSMASLLTG